MVDDNSNVIKCNNNYNTNKFIMKIDKKLIVSALDIYKAFLVKRDISEHDQTLEILIKVNEQIKLIKEWKK